MTRKSEVISAADIGYGSVKAGIKGHDPLHFPSGAAPADRVPVRMNGTSELPLDVKGTPYLAGFEQDMSEHRRHAAGLFAKSPDYHALFLETLHRLGAEKIDTLVLGLPSREFESDAKEYLKATFAGSHLIRGKKYSVDKVLVADQPIGTAALHYKNNERALSRERLVVIDIGYGTTDIALVVRGAVDRSASMSFDRAMSTVCEAMSRDLSTAEASLTATWIDECLRSGQKKVSPRGVEINLAKAAAESASSVAQVIVSSTLGRIGSFSNVSQVVITGGGAHVLGEPIKKIIKGPEVTVMKKPVIANLLGFIAMASSCG